MMKIDWNVVSLNMYIRRESLKDIQNLVQENNLQGKLTAETSLLTACNTGNFEIISYLLDNGANRQTSIGLPLYILKYRYPECYEKIVKKMLKDKLLNL